MILTLIPFVIFFIFFSPYTKGFIRTLIVSLLSVEILIWGSIVILSSINGLSFAKYRYTWAFISLLTLCIFFPIFFKKKSLYLTHFQNCFSAWKKQQTAFKVITFVYLLFFIGIALISIVTIPYNYDSMTYHMARIAHWIQNGNTLPYATNVPRQIYSPVLTEYNIMHTILLHGNDQFSNFVQGFSFICNTMLVFGIARRLSLSYYYSFFSSFIFAMSPMMLAQAFSTQTDEFATLWLLCFIYLLVDFFECEHITFCKDHILKVIALSSCLMFGYHSKPTVCIIMFISLLALLAKAIKKRDKIKDLIFLVLIAVGIMLLLFIPEWINNLHLYHSILAANSYGHIVLATTDIRYYILNFYKNISYLLTSGIFPAFDNFIINLGTILANILGISIDDPLISVSTPFRYSEDIYHHDTASYFVFTTLCILGFIIYLIKLLKRKKELDYFQKLYGIIGFSSFFILLAITKWSPWKCRYFIANAAILIPFIVLLCKQLYDKKKIYGYIIFTFAFIFSAYYGINAFRYHAEYFKQSIKEYDDREEVYYLQRIDYKWPMQLTREYMEEKGFGDIGLLIGADTFEYPLLEYFDYSVRIEHIDISGDYLRDLEDSAFVPRYIIALEDSRYTFQVGDEYIYNNTTYICTNIFENKVQLLEMK